MLVSHGTVILVIDGAKMVLYRNRGKDFAADLEIMEHNTKHVSSTALMGTDKPGRNFSSMGSARSSYQAADYHQAEEDAFVKTAIEELNSLAQQSNLDFIVVAAPRVLGVIRKHYSSDLRKRIVAEIDKDYAERTTADVTGLLHNYKV